MERGSSELIRMCRRAFVGPVKLFFAISPRGPGASARCGSLATAPQDLKCFWCPPTQPPGTRDLHFCASSDKARQPGVAPVHVIWVLVAHSCVNSHPPFPIPHPPRLFRTRVLRCRHWVRFCGMIFPGTGQALFGGAYLGASRTYKQSTNSCVY